MKRILKGSFITSFFVLVLSLAPIVSLAADFKRETIYQIITDRFYDGDATNNNPGQSSGLYDSSHTNWRAYWGGDLAGIQAKIAYLAGLGVPESDLRIVDDGASTYESLAATARFLRKRDVTDVLFVTSPAHAKRVSVIADEVGLTGGVSPTGHRAPLASLGRETLAVAAGRVVGFGRLDALDH